MLTFLLLAFLHINLVNSGLLETQTCNINNGRLVYNQDADAFIGVLTALRMNGGDGYGCGEYHRDRFQELEALRFAVDRLNMKNGTIDGVTITDSYVPGVKLGLIIEETCNNEDTVADQLVSLIPNMAAQEEWCTVENQTPLFLGLIGSGSSALSMKTAPILNQYGIRQISYSDTAEDLRFDNFVRTVPLDSQQADVMVDTMAALQWTHVGIVYTKESYYGKDGLKALQRAMQGKNICPSITLGVTSNSDMEAVLHRLMASNLTGMVYFGESDVAEQLFTTAGNFADAGRLQWIVSDTISNSLGDITTYARGMLGVKILQRHITEFEDHWVGIDPENPSLNWYKEWYMAANLCVLPGMTSTRYTLACTIPTTEQRRLVYEQQPLVEYAISSVYFYARALKDVHNLHCNSQPGVCDDLRNDLSQYDYSTQFSSLGSEFTYSSEERIPSLSSTSTPPFNEALHVRPQGILQEFYHDVAYSITNYKLQNSNFKFYVVGQYLENSLQMDTSDVVFYSPDRQSPLSSTPTSTCQSNDDVCHQCDYVGNNFNDIGKGRGEYGYTSGSILIGSLFGIHRKGSSSTTCGDLNLDYIQMAYAFKYAIDALENRVLNGIQLGSVIFDDCASTLRAGTLINNLHAGILDLGEEVHPENVILYIGGDNLETNNAISEATSSVNIPFLSIGANTGKSDSGITDDSSLTSTFSTNESERIRAIVKILSQLEIKYIQDVFEYHEHGIERSRILREIAAEYGICVAYSHGITDNSVYESVIKELSTYQDAKVIVVQMMDPMLTDFLDHYNKSSSKGMFQFVLTKQPGDHDNVPDHALYIDIRNQELKEFNDRRFSDYLNMLAKLELGSPSQPWYQEWFQDLHQCYHKYLSELPNGYDTVCPTSATNTLTNTDRYQQTPKVLEVFATVYGAAYGLRETLKHYCGDNFDSVCIEFQTAPDRSMRLMDNIRKVDIEEYLFPFDFSIDEGEPKYEFDIVNIQDGQHVNVGKFTTYEKGMTLDTARVMTKTDITNSCSGNCLNCQYMAQLNNHMYIEGDLIVGAIFNIHDKGSSVFSCGPLKMEQFQFTEAIRNAIDTLNQGNIVPGVTLGSLVLDGCDLDTLSSTVISAFYTGQLDLDDIMVDPNAVLSWLSVNTAQSLAIGDTTSGLGVPQLGITATSSTIKSQLPLFYHTVSTDDIMARGIIQLLVDLDINNINIVYDDSEYGKQGFESIRDKGKENGICTLHSFTSSDDAASVMTSLAASDTHVTVLFVEVPAIRNLLTAKSAMGTAAAGVMFISGEPYGSFPDMTSGLESSAEGMIVYKINSPSVPTFDNYIANNKPFESQNPWFDEYYQTLFDCNLEGYYGHGSDCQNPDSTPVTEAPGYAQDFALENVMNAVYATAYALDKILEDVCGDNYDGLCDDFKQMDPSQLHSMLADSMGDVSFESPSGDTFMFTDREYHQGYTLYHLLDNGQTEMIGVYKDSGLTINNMASLNDKFDDVMTNCGAKCSECMDMPVTEEEFTYIDGDIILGGMFDVHKAGTTQFTCGDINTVAGYQLVEAFNFAIQYVNNDNGVFDGILNGVKLGGLGLDTCFSSTRAGNLITNIQSGLIQLPVGSKTVDVSKMDAFIGAYDSDSSSEVADVLGPLKVPQVSYGSTSTIFRDTDKYPYFLRTVPADDNQARAMAAILLRLGSDYVQVVYSKGSYGEYASNDFKKVAQSTGICVGQSIQIEEPTADAADDAVETLLNNQLATVVIVFVNENYISPLLLAITRNQDAKGNFKIIASEAWSDNTRVLSGASLNTAQVVTLGVETADVHEFDDYLQTKSKNSSLQDKWFRDYYKVLCENSNDPSKCADGSQSIVTIGGSYVQDDFILYTVNAVYATALGIHEALTEICGDDYDGVCDEYWNDDDRRVKIFNGIKEAEFEDDTEQTFKFNDAGESNRGYHIYQLRQAGAQPFYANIGTYNDSRGLRINSDFDVEWGSSCEQPDACAECPLTGNRRTSYYEEPSENGVNLVGIMSIHNRNPSNPLECGDINLNNFENMLAFFYAINQANNRADIVDGLDLGGLFIDSCDSTFRVQHYLFSFLTRQGLCSETPRVTSANSVGYVLSTSSESQAAMALLSPLQILGISSSATSTALSDVPYFLRTVPADNHQSAAFAELIRAMGWKYVAIIHHDSSYGANGAQGVIDNLKTSNASSSACVGSNNVFSPDLTDDELKDIIQDIYDSGIRSIVLFTSDTQARQVLQAVKDLGLENKFTFIGSEGWANSQSVVEGLESIAAGSITMQIKTKSSTSFMEWIMTLNLGDHGNIPDDWFEEFWQETFECRLQNATVPMEKYNTRSCSTNDRLTEDVLPKNPFTFNTIIATEIIANGIAGFTECAKATGSVTACTRKLRDAYIHQLYGKVKDASWTSPSGDLEDGTDFTFMFTDEGDGGMLGYNILNYQKDGDNYMYKVIGGYSDSDFIINLPEYRSHTGTAIPFPSACPTGTTCQCISGTGKNGGDSVVGGDDDDGEVTPKTLPQVGGNENFSEVWGIVLSVLAGLGILITLILFVYLLIFYPVRGGTSPLGFLLLFGVLLLYVLCFAFVVNPSYEVCTIRQFCSGVIYALCFACLLVKCLNTWRIGDVFDQSEIPTYKRLGHPCSLFFIAIGITLVQCIINTEWLILDPPGVEIVEYPEGSNIGIPRCSESDFHNESFVLSHIYVMILIFLTLLFSVVTWDSEENRRESRWICITTCFTIVIFIIWCCISIIMDLHFRDPAIGYCAWGNATVILLCIFWRKIYLLRRYQKSEEADRKSHISAVTLEKDPGAMYANPLYMTQEGTMVIEPEGSHHSNPAFIYEDNGRL